MGYSVSYLCVRGKDRQAILGDLALEELPGQVEAFEAKIALAELPGGWTVIVYNRQELKPNWLDALARDAIEAMSCCFVDTVMASEAEGRRADGSSWVVRHNPDHGTYNLDHDGEMPPQFASVVAAQTAKQDEAGDEWVDHIYDVPADLVKAMTGFRADDESGEISFTPLQNIRVHPVASGGGLFARLFGRR